MLENKKEKLNELPRVVTGSISRGMQGWSKVFDGDYGFEILGLNGPSATRELLD